MESNNTRNVTTTRLGFSPFAPQQHIGVYRSFLTGILLAKKEFGDSYARIDDTNPLHPKENIAPLISDFEQLLDENIISRPPFHALGRIAISGTNVEALVQSQRTDLYLEYAERLYDIGYASRHDNAMYFDVKKFINNYGDIIGTPYNDKNDRKSSISQSIPKLEFPLLVGEGRPLWHLTSVVDDHELRVTDIIRAQDKIENQVPQTILIKALGLEAVNFYYTKIMDGENSKQTPPLIQELIGRGLSIMTIKSYLYSTIVDADKIYTDFSEVLNDFSRSKIRAGQLKFDLKKIESIERKL